MPVVLGSEAGPAAAPGLAGRGQAAGELFAVIEAQGAATGCAAASVDVEHAADRGLAGGADRAVSYMIVNEKVE
jgi:hypothetical protein